MSTNREHHITLPPDTTARIKAGEQTTILTPIDPQPTRLDDAHDGTWSWPGTPHPRYDDLTMAHAIHEQRQWSQGDTLHATAQGATGLALKIVDARPQLLPRLTDEDARAAGYPGGHDSIPNYQFSATPLEHLRHAWQEHHPGTPWRDAWVWRLDIQPPTMKETP